MVFPVTLEATAPAPRHRHRRWRDVGVPLRLQPSCLAVFFGSVSLGFGDTCFFQVKALETSYSHGCKWGCHSINGIVSDF
jgi:hypothetical protein